MSRILNKVLIHHSLCAQKVAIDHLMEAEQTELHQLRRENARRLWDKSILVVRSSWEWFLLAVTKPRFYWSFPTNWLPQCAKQVDENISGKSGSEKMSGIQSILSMHWRRLMYDRTGLPSDSDTISSITFCPKI